MGNEENIKLVRPKLDIIFKKVFSEDMDVTKSFISAVLDTPKERITNIVVKSPENLPEYYDGKLSQVDLNLQVDDKIVDVEMQLCNFEGFDERVLFYWAKLFSSDLNSGKPYLNLNSTISINILNFKHFDCDEMRSKFQLLETTRHSLFSDKCTLYFFELPKLEKNLDKYGKLLELWLRFIDAETEEELDMLNTTNIPEIHEAVNILRKLGAREDIREEARIREKSIRDYDSAMITSQMKGIKIGEEKSRKETIAKMRQKGYTEEQIRDLFN